MIVWLPVISAVAGAVIGVLLGHLFTPRVHRRGGERNAAEQVEFMRNLLAFLLVGAFISVLPVLTFKAIPEGNKDIIVYMVGQLSGMATMALGFYFVNKAGQDAVDAKKAENTETALKTIQTVAENASNKTATEPDVILEPGETAQAEGTP